MAGNTINMQPGSNYIDIHDNEVVNLNIDKGKVKLEQDEGAKSVEKNRGGRPKRSGVTIKKSFIYDAGEETAARLQYFFTGLKSLGWIRSDTVYKNFQTILSGEDTSCRVVWTGDINTLTELFRELVDVKKIVRLPEGESIWIMVNARFWDHEGNKEFGNEKLGSTRAPRNTKDKIDVLVKVLNPKVPIEELKEMMRSQEE